MTKDEAIKLALEAFKAIKNGTEFWDMYPPDHAYGLAKTAITALEALAEQPAQQEPTLQDRLGDAPQSVYFYRRRVEALQKWQSKMRDPERTIVCDILANGCTLEPAGDRYKQAEQPAQPQQKPDFMEFRDWASAAGYDVAYAHDNIKCIPLNNMTGNLWRAWQAAHNIKEQPCKHERINDDGFGGVWSFCKHCHKEWTNEMEARQP